LLTAVECIFGRVRDHLNAGTPLVHDLLWYRLAFQLS
jgi:hypothetical protein